MTVGAAPSGLEADGLAKAYGPRTVLGPLDLVVPAGSLIAVVGANGTGKSSLLGRLAGTTRGPGRVTLAGREVAPDRQRRVAYLPQRVRLPASARVGEVLALFAALRGPVADRVHLPDGFLPESGSPVGHLSGGQARRVALAASLAGAPELLLLDEPFANLDDDGRRLTGDLLLAHVRAGAIVMVASPSAVELLAVADRVLVLEDGQITLDGPPATYLARMQVSVWMPLDGLPATDHASLAALPSVLRARRAGDWMVLDCLEPQTVDVLRAVEARGVPADRIRLTGSGVAGAIGENDAGAGG